MALADELQHYIGGKWWRARAQMHAELAKHDLAFDPSLSLDEARERTLAQLKIVAGSDIPVAGFAVAAGGTGQPGVAVTGIEVLAQYDLSLMVKAGVQWGLFGGAVQNLGTERHHALVPDIISLELLGCFAMTETGHGSDVQRLETTATYDVATQEFVIDSPTPSARKDYIGNAAKHGTMAAVFAQLITQGTSHGVHCFLVPIRDAKGKDLPGVTTSDCGYKGGLKGVDNGRISFDHVRVARENLLNRFGNVDEAGVYSSPIDNENTRFFTMLGTLIRGRVTVGGCANAAAEVALSIAGRYALERRQFGPAPEREVTLMDYRLHQRRLMPLIARSYAYRFAQNQLVARMHRLQTSDNPDPLALRELESRAAGLKAMQTWHAMRAIQESREACGGAGYLAANRIVTLRDDVDVFTTFEGDNHVLLQLVAKELLTGYANEVRGLDTVGLVRFAANDIKEIVRERSVAGQLIQSLIVSRNSADHAELLNRGTQLALFEGREERVLDTLARRLRRASGKDADEAFEMFNSAQDHVIRCGRTHVERIVLEAFTAGIARTRDDDAADLLRDVCSLYALTSIEDDLDWFMVRNRISHERGKQVTSLVNQLCAKLRPHTLDLIEGFGIPAESLNTEILA